MEINELYYDIVLKFADVNGKPLPKRILSMGDKDKGWCLKLNPTEKEINNISAFSVYVIWNGWPAGTIDPRGGILASGDIANEKNLYKWLNDL